MTWHIVKGAMYMLNNPGSIDHVLPRPKGTDASVASSHVGTNTNIAAVIDVALGSIATEQSDFEEHVSISGIRLAFVASWSGGPTDSTGGTFRVYFDPDVPQALYDAPDLLNGVRRQMEFFLRGEYGTTFQFFKGFKPLDSREAKIAISVHPDDEQVTITVGDFGRMQMTPIRGVGGALIRILHAGPEFRDDVVEASDIEQVSSWHDPDIAKWQGNGTAEISDVYWKWSALDRGVQLP